jgi:hypothetical protein
MKIQFKYLLLILLPLSLAGCVNENNARRARMALFIGIDVSGSFYNSGHYQDALNFLAHYIYGHLNTMGQLKPIKGLFVGSIGGQHGDETKSFRPIHDFQGKSVEQIKSDLSAWFPKSDALTDFNVFFNEVATISKKRNFSLSPITILLVSDGIPDFPGRKGDDFKNVNLSELEYLSRNVTIRLLYATPVISKKWETEIERRRVRMWTVDNDVMEGWTSQILDKAPAEDQLKLWTWIKDNVDYRVRRPKPF